MCIKITDYCCFECCCNAIQVWINLDGLYISYNSGIISFVILQLCVMDLWTPTKIPLAIFLAFGKMLI
jgi:hypothetical protein